MIGHITAGPGIDVTGGFRPPYISPGSQSAGMIRYNTNSQVTEVYDGNAWLTVSSTPSVSLTSSTLEVIDWARKKMQEEKNLEQLMNRHPGLRDTYEKFEIMKALCSKEEDNVAR
jgi:hypothetical protein